MVQPLETHRANEKMRQKGKVSTSKYNSYAKGDKRHFILEWATRQGTMTTEHRVLREHRFEVPQILHFNVVAG